MESKNSIYTQPNSQYIEDLIEFGFGREEVTLALQISQNDKE